ncbi:MAG: phospholipase D family protein [Myxococcota bacterium]
MAATDNGRSGALDPNHRMLLTDALTPPPGMAFDQGLATTFSLDLPTLMMVPLQLVLSGAEDARRLLQDQVALLEAVQRAASRLHIFCQAGSIRVPDAPRPLLSLLEKLVVEVTPPGNGDGVFHPKLWLLRFVPTGGDGRPLLRLLILSRNLTPDRSWDLSLQLDGRPGKRRVKENDDLAKLIERLPGWGLRDVGEDVTEQAHELAAEVRRTRWRLPPGFESVRFHAVWPRKSGWRPENPDELVVISPFLSGSALDALAERTDGRKVLVSRPEELEGLSKDIRERFDEVSVLDDSAHHGDSTDEAAEGDRQGLHAKAYVFKRGWRTHMVMGSANATHAALMTPRNVEVLAELIGLRSKVGTVDGMVMTELRPYLRPFEPGEVEAPADDAAVRSLERARRRLASLPWKARCERADSEESWSLVVSLQEEPDAPAVEGMRLWPVTLREEHAIDATGLLRGDPVQLSDLDVTSLTGFLAVELSARDASGADIRERFVVNAPPEGMPEERHAAIVRSAIRNRSGFVRYLLLLLGDMDGDGGLTELAATAMGNGDGGAFGGDGQVPLLEEMTRVLARDPARLVHVARLVERLREDEEARALFPERFLEVWEIFEQVREEGG